ncbi:MAG TPA: xanthine dehydrogenase family protein subunit M [Marmoricola sp.]|nr:xanthine dehydrogenase family protein subunit M [Marmoricola sp.]
MKELVYERPSDARTAVSLVSGHQDACFLAGGTNLVDHLKLGVASPGLVVDISRLPLTAVEEYDGGLRIGANVRNADLAAHPRVRTAFPVLSQALLAGASPQIRNQATTGGNLLQRTRCVYFQDVTTPCNKREPGSGCPAVEGYGRHNAVLGASPECVAVYPGDMAVALVALDAQALVLGPGGERRLPVADLHRLPGDRPEQDTVLEHGELITAVEVPWLPDGTRSGYYKARDRASYAFALASAAGVLRLDGDTVVEARLAWGGVAHRPWRARLAEQLLTGSRLDHDTVRAAADAELEAARAGRDNGYKATLVRQVTWSLLRGLGEAAP